MNLALKQPPSSAYPLDQIRADFPILAQQINGKRCCFLDSGASAQKPTQVLDAMANSIHKSYANIHRGTYQFSQDSTAQYEQARHKIFEFLGAPRHDQIIFGYNTTSLINLVAHSYPKAFMEQGDEIIISEMEHHANLVPWLIAAKQHGFKLVVCPIDDQGNFLMDAFLERLNSRTKLVAITHISNVLGTITPIAEIAEATHKAGAKLLVDGSQAVQHVKLDLAAMNPDFYVFTGHKLYGPTGIGVLYGKTELLDAMPPFLSGGDMIKQVDFDTVEFAPLPAKFEAGTPPILEAFGLHAAIEYIEQIGIAAIAAHEHDLLEHATSQLQAIDGLTIYGTAKAKAPVISFGLSWGHPHDVANILDMQGICVRAGLHCAQPLHKRLNITGSVRASFGCYNGMDDVDQLVAGLHKAKKLLG